MKSQDAIDNFLDAVGDESVKAFRRGIRSGKSGRVYKRRGGSHRASAPGEYPAKDTGALQASIDTARTPDSVQIGTGEFYAIFLRNGTRKMARRKMSDNALQEGSQRARGRLKNWVGFKHV